MDKFDVHDIGEMQAEGILYAAQPCPPGEHLVIGTECVRCGKFISPFRPNVNLIDGELNRNCAQCRDAQPDNDRHQSQRDPAENKFHKGNGDDGKHYWLTPWDAPEFKALVADFGPFDFDPCPYPRPPGFDGITCEWGQVNYVNPPFGSYRLPKIDPKTGKQKINKSGKRKGLPVWDKIGPTAWMRKAIRESEKGKRVVLVFPVDKWVLMMTKACGAGDRIRNLGDVRWLATEDGSIGDGTGRHIAAFVLGPL